MTNSPSATPPLAIFSVRNTLFGSIFTHRISAVDLVSERTITDNTLASISLRRPDRAISAYHGLEQKQNERRGITGTIERFTGSIVANQPAYDDRGFASSGGNRQTTNNLDQLEILSCRRLEQCDENAEHPVPQPTARRTNCSPPPAKRSTHPTAKGNQTILCLRCYVPAADAPRE